MGRHGGESRRGRDHLGVLLLTPKRATAGAHMASPVAVVLFLTVLMGTGEGHRASIQIGQLRQGWCILTPEQDGRRPPMYWLLGKQSGILTWHECPCSGCRHTEKHPWENDTSDLVLVTCFLKAPSGAVAGCPVVECTSRWRVCALCWRCQN